MKKELSKICKRFGVKLAILFGSTAKGLTHSQSDTDIAVSLTKPLTLKRELAIRHDLGKLFKSEIDLVNLDKASPLLLGEIAFHGKLIHGSKNDFSYARVYAAKQYFDFEPYFKLREKLVHKSLSKHA